MRRAVMLLRLGLVCVVGIGMILTTTARAAVWADETALWEDAARLAPQKPRVWVNLGRQYHLQGQLELARMAYRRAITAAAAPERSRDEQIVGRAIVELNLALVQERLGETRSARWLMALAVDRVPSNADVRRVEAWIGAP